MISRSSPPPGTPFEARFSAMMDFTVPTKSFCCSWTVETFTATRGACSPAARQRPKSCSALRIAQNPTSRIIPVSSRRGMNWAGGTRPVSGSCQRMSASTLAIEPLVESTFGW